MGRALAIAVLRLKLASRRFQGVASWLNAILGIVMAAVGGLFALAGAVVFAILIPALASDGPERARIGYLVVFYFAFIFGFLVPLVRGTLDRDLDVRPFIIFPLSRRRLYALALGASAIAPDHLFYYPSLLGVALVAPLILGLRSVLACILIALLVIACVGWSHAMSTFLTSLMRGRRMRETVAVIGVGGLILVSMGPAIVQARMGVFDRLDSEQHQKQGAAAEDEPGQEVEASPPAGPAGEVPKGGARIDLSGVVHVLGQIAALLPPSLAADGMTSLHRTETPLAAVGAALGLLAWSLGGLVVGYYVFERLYLRERKSVAKETQARPDRHPRRAWMSADARGFAFLPLPVRAVAAKELHYFLRSTAGRVTLTVGPAVLVMFCAVVGIQWRGSFLGLQTQQIRLYGLVVYAVMLCMNTLYNSFAWDAEGAKVFFLSPVRGRDVLLGKNLAIWCVAAALFLVALLSWSALAGGRSLLAIANAFETFAIVSLLATATGNVTSVLYPVRREMSRTRNTPSQAALFAALVVFAVAVGVIGTLLIVPLLMDRLMLQPALLLVGLMVAAGLYVLSVGHAGRLLQARRERLLEALHAGS